MALPGDIILEKIRELDGVEDAMDKAKDIWAEIPPDTKTALAKKWLLKANNFVSDSLQYHEHEQEADGRRIIPLPLALNALQDLEARLVETQVLDIKDILWKKWRKARYVWTLLKVSWDDYWSLLKLAWGALTGITEAQFYEGVLNLATGLAAVTGLVLEILSVRAFIEVAVSVTKERNQCIATLRKKALPQSFGPRYRRRKRAR